MLLIFFRVSSGIRGLFLSARDTVALQTPAAFAMSANVGECRRLCWFVRWKVLIHSGMQVGLAEFKKSPNVMSVQSGFEIQLIRISVPLRYPTSLPKRERDWTFTLRFSQMSLHRSDPFRSHVCRQVDMRVETFEDHPILDFRI